MIVDMRELNKLLKKHKFTLPTLSRDRVEYNDLLGFWTYDLTSSYQHVEIAKDDQPYFGIEWNGIYYHMLVCPYGCSSVPEVFQTVASVPVQLLQVLGCCPDITTVQGWKDVASGTAPLPPRGRRFRVSTKQYLDDYGSLLPKQLRALDGSLVEGAQLLDLAPRLSQSFHALLLAFGWSVSTKSEPNPFATNTFLGWEIEVKSSEFRIPGAKILRNAKFFKELLAKPIWTLKEGAKVTGRILQFKLIWGGEASLLARPIYHALADILRVDDSWHQTFQPAPLAREMVQRALAMLLPGPDQFIVGPMLCRHDQLINTFDTGLWSQLEEQLGSHAPDIVQTDASDKMSGGWHSTDSLEKTISQDEYLVRTARTGLAMAQLLPADAVPESSTYREVLAVRDWFRSPERSAVLLERIQQHQKYGLLHLLDSQAAVIILRKGSSRVPEIHRLVLEIYDLTRTLRRQHGLVFAWVPREQNQVADAFSKCHDWRITPEAFASLHQTHRFTLDAFAAPHERAARDLAFCSRFSHEDSSGDAKVTSWGGHTVWAFPPPTLRMISLALRKWRDTDVASMVLCVPAWRSSAPWWDLVWDAPWCSYQKLTRAATKLGSGTTPVTASFPLVLFHFKR